jgi:hypothetical protein
LIRGALCLFLVILSLFLITPATFDHSFTHRVQTVDSSPSTYSPQCPCPAFNTTNAQFDRYTNKTVSLSYGNFPNNTRPNPGFPGSSLKWFGTITDPKTGTPIPSTGPAFNYTIGTNVAISQSVNWTTVNVPKGVGSATFVKFNWNGTIGAGTSAKYQLYNASKTLPALNVTQVGPPFPLIVPPLNLTTASGVPFSCGYSNVCYDVTRFAGFNLTLAFIFNSNATGKGLRVQVSDIEVASVGTAPTEATLHTMSLNSNQVQHAANVTLTYNATVTYKDAQNRTKAHPWTWMVTTFYFPASYNLTSIVNATTTLWSSSLTVPHAVDQGPCLASSCTKSQFIALNATKNTATGWKVLIKAVSRNAEASLQTTLGGVKTDFWVPGDSLQVRANDTQGVNVAGSNVISIVSPSPPATNLTQTFSAPSRGTFLFNFTSVLPQAPLGSNWNVTSVFFSSYDYGVVFHLFRVEQVQVNQGSFGYSGDNRRLVVVGSLSYGSNSTKPGNILGNVVAIDSGSSSSPLTVSASSSSLGKGMYISNVTLLNGEFTAGVSLIGTFTVVNPTGVNENATIILEHEWASQQSHGSSVTFNPPTGDFPFNPSNRPPIFVYKLNATLTLSGIRIVVTSLTSGNSVTVNLPSGTPPVTSVRQHSGLFKITITSKTLLSTQNPCSTPTCTNSIESPSYAYILVNPPLPGRLLASAPITMGTSGAFTSVITSGGELGARKLVFFVLGQDPSGVAIATQDKSTPESTILQATLDNVPTATQGQSITMTLHLQSNSTILNMEITVGLNVDGQLVQSKSNVSISYGSKVDVPFTFNAPSNLGVHTFTFYSPEYGAPLITGTLQVSVLQSSLQVIIPAIIGVAAAIVILLFYLYRKKPETALESPAKDKSAGGKVTKPSPGTSTSKSLT